MIQLLQIDESFEFSEALGSHELPHLKDPVDCCFLERSKSPSLRRNILLPNLPWCTFPTSGRLAREVSLEKVALGAQVKGLPER